MEGGGFWQGNLPNHPSLCPSSLPLTAIQRFSLGKNLNHGSSSPCGGAIRWLPRPSLAENCIGENLLFDAERNATNANMHLNEEDESRERNSKRVEKRAKGCSFTTMIKGQWTDEEDRKLIKSVKQHGVRKWALVAEQMAGRTGKQCRERWHNHLRPDIKKDTWSEEEEKMLIQAHKILGNKWAEIAKRIPGRTENSIKNHWNATKRRQKNSKSKIKKYYGWRSNSSFLEDYIKNLTTSIAPTTTTTSGSTVTEEVQNDSLSLSELSESSLTDDSPQLTNQTYDDELNFMINFFGAKNEKNPHPTEAKKLQNDNQNSIFSALNLPGLGNQLLNDHGVDQELHHSTHLPSDLFLSYLLDGPAAASPSMDYFCDKTMVLDSITGPGSASGKKDMDLMEMVAASVQFSLGGECN